MRNDIIHIVTTQSAKTISASASDTSDKVELTKAAAGGFLSVQWVVTGTGTCSIEFLCSNNDSNYTVPEGGSPIQEGITAGNGIKGFQPPLCKWIKIKVTETGTSNAVVVTVSLAVQ